jgi:hypothetical protein
VASGNQGANACAKALNTAPVKVLKVLLRGIAFGAPMDKEEI